MPSFTPPAALHDRDQPRQPARPQRPRVHQSGRHRLLGGDRAEGEQGLLGRRPGRGLDPPVHQALSDHERPLEFAEVPVRRVVRHGAQLRARLPAARGRRRSERASRCNRRSSTTRRRAIRSALLPTSAADAWYHEKVTLQPAPPDLPTFAAQVTQFAATDYAAALKAFPHADPATVSRLGAEIGIDPTTLTSWTLDVAATDNRGTALFLLTLLQAAGTGARRLRRPGDGDRHRHRGARSIRNPAATTRP